MLRWNSKISWYGWVVFSLAWEWPWNASAVGNVVKSWKYATAEVLEVIPWLIVPTEKISIDFIKNTVSEYYNLSIWLLEWPRRKRSISRPRHVAMYLCTELTKKSLPVIWREFWDRDHTTIMHGRDNIAGLIVTDPQIQKDVGLITKKIMSAQNISFNLEELTIYSAQNIKSIVLNHFKITNFTENLSAWMITVYLCEALWKSQWEIKEVTSYWSELTEAIVQHVETHQAIFRGDIISILQIMVQENKG